MHNRFASLFIAALLPLMLFKWFLPTPNGQIDMWLMWAIAMLGVGLPLLYAEIGLAFRSQLVPMQGMQDLTRQADASVVWRSFAWSTLAIALVMAALGIDAASGPFLEALSGFGIDVAIPGFALALGFMVVAGILSLLGGITLIAAVVLVALAFIISVFTQLDTINVALTPATLSEWARAVVLALVSVGVGTGLFWFNNPAVNDAKNKAANVRSDDASRGLREIATKTVFPIWLTQLIIGSVILLFAAPSPSAISTLIYTLGILAAAAYLIHYASTQLATRFNRFGIWIATLISIMVTLLLVAVASPTILKMILMVVSLLGALILAIFVGWQMKISHMRKSLNFKSEGRYNIWRIAIRIIAPVIIVSAILGWLLA